MTKPEDRGTDRIAPFEPSLTKSSERQVQAIRSRTDNRGTEQVQNVDGYWISIE